MTINNKSERNYRGKCLGWPVTSYGGASPPIQCCVGAMVCRRAVLEIKIQHCFTLEGKRLVEMFPEDARKYIILLSSVSELLSLIIGDASRNCSKIL